MGGRENFGNLFSVSRINPYASFLSEKCFWDLVLCRVGFLFYFFIRRIIIRRPTWKAERDTGVQTRSYRKPLQIILKI